jgi:hypothetical protein
MSDATTLVDLIAPRLADTLAGMKETSLFSTDPAAMAIEIVEILREQIEPESVKRARRSRTNWSEASRRISM